SLSAAGGNASERQDQRMRLDWAELRLEERTHEERMAGQLNHAGAAFLIQAADLERRASDPLLPLWIDAEIAVITLGRLFASIKGCGTRPAHEPYPSLLANERASKRRNQELVSLWIGFRMIRRAMAHHVPGVFDDGVLK